MVKLLIFLAFNIDAAIFDFSTIQQGVDFYEQKKYQLAADKFEQIDNEAAKINQANALYKKKLYSKSITIYKTIDSKKLQFDKFYNLGNAYAQNNQIKEAIQSYESSLKIKQDFDAKFNLKLLRKQQKKQQKNKKQDKKNNKKTKNNKKNTGKNKKSQQNKKSNKKSNQSSQQQKLNQLQRARLKKSLQKNIRTLMIPITKQQQQKYEYNPW